MYVHIGNHHMCISKRNSVKLSEYEREYILIIIAHICDMNVNFNSV